MLTWQAILILVSLVLVTTFSGKQGNRFSNPCDNPLKGSSVHVATATRLADGGVFPQTMSTAADTWYGIRQVPKEDIQTVAENLGGAVITLGLRAEYDADIINARLDMAQSAGYRAVAMISTDETCSKRPWEWNGNEWVFPQFTIETLQGIAHHPALFAIYALHEPFDESNECWYTVEQQKELYQLLKGYTDGVPIWSDVGGLAIQEEDGHDLSDGICDYCGTFHHRFRSDWTSEQCLEETLSWIDADLEAQQRLMPNSQIVFQIQTWSLPSGKYPWRLPTPQELTTVRDHLCALNQPMLYYPWSHRDYDLTLKDAPQLWPVVAEGCTYSPPDISGSDKAVNQTETQVGDTLVYTLTLSNAGEMDTAFLVTDTLDANTAFVGFLEASPGGYGHAAGVVTWTGMVNGMSQVQLAFLATVSTSAPGVVTNTVRFDDGAGGVYTDTATTSIIAPELRATKQVEPGSAVLAGAFLTYTVVMSNTSGDVAQVSLSDTIPAHTIYISGSAQVFPPPPVHNPPQYVGQSVIWNDDIAPGKGVTITFNVQIEPGTAMGTIVGNVAWVDEPSDPTPAMAYRAFNIVAAYELYLPVVLSNWVVTIR